MKDENKKDIVALARELALRAHTGQFRLNKDKEPYSSHIAQVASLVEESGGTDEEIASAWLHDVVEDTPVTLAEITELFGKDVGDIVDGLTDLPEFESMPLFSRKTKQAERIRSKGAQVKRVKIADQISNVRSVATDPPVAWDKQKCLDYAEGAKLIVSECRGISEFLDKNFEKAYEAVIKVYS